MIANMIAVIEYDNGDAMCVPAARVHKKSRSIEITPEVGNDVISVGAGGDTVSVYSHGQEIASYTVEY